MVLLSMLELLAEGIDLSIRVILRLQLLVQDHDCCLQPIVLNLELSGIATLREAELARPLIGIGTLH